MLLAGFAYMAEPISVIWVADDHETDIKRARVLQLANDTLAEIGSDARVPPEAVEGIAADRSEYGTAQPETLALIRRFAQLEGLIADPVYEGKALRGIEQLISEGLFSRSSTDSADALWVVLRRFTFDADQFDPPHLRRGDTIRPEQSTSRTNPSRRSTWQL